VTIGGFMYPYAEMFEAFVSMLTNIRGMWRTVGSFETQALLFQSARQH
jgi:hypothetical protein